MQPPLLRLGVCGGGYMLQLLKALAAFASIWLSVSAAAAPLAPDFAAIDVYFQDAMKADRVPGATLVIVKGERIVHAANHGEAAPGRPAKSKTPFLLGSMSKAFTALAVMQLVEAGKIDLDAPVTSYLPWFRAGRDVASSRITVRQALNHTTGIPTMAPQGRGDAPSLRAHVEALRRTEAPGRPGAVHEYASPNYLILGAIVEEVSGLGFALYVQRNIFAPLDMRQSFTDREAAQRAGLAQGHRYWGGFPITGTLSEETGRLPTAAMMASAEDLGHFLIMQLNGGRFRGRTLISPEGIAAMHRGSVEGGGFQYAMGWRASPIAGAPAVHHGGILPDYRGKMVMLPSHGWGVVVLTNSASMLPVAPTSHRVADAVAGALAGGRLPEPGSNFRNMSWVLLAIMAATLLVHVWKVARLPRWKVPAGPKAIRKSWLSAITDIAFPVALLIGLPLWLGLSLPQAMRSAPDLVWWLLAICALSLGIGLYKLAKLVSGRPVPSPEAPPVPSRAGAV